MIRRLNLYRFYLRLVTYSLPFISFLLAGYVRNIPSDVSDHQVEMNDYFVLLLITTLVWSIAAEHYRLCKVEELFIERTGVRAAFSSCTATYTVLLAFVFFAESARGVSRLFFVVSAAVLMGSVLVTRAGFRSAVRRENFARPPLRIVVVGTDRFARRAAKRLMRGPLSTCEIIGYVRLEGQEVCVTDAPLFDLAELANVTATRRIDDVVVALEPSRFADFAELLVTLQRLSAPVRAVVDFGEGIVVREKLFQFGRLQMLDLTQTPAEALDYLLVKRVFDFTFSALVLTCLAPLMVLIAVAIRLTSAGPIFFRQERVGLNGKIFSMYKFRSMKLTSAQESDTVWTTEDDPRCTSVGRLLRRTSLDELPQFLNVLKGDMSVVGPRPERPHFVQKFLNDVAMYNSRHRLKVGITGWAQVNGWRGDTSIKRRLDYDLYYLQNWSFLFDLRIIVMTVLSGISSKNAY
jgi:Undecaprenyl-phosphate glucose phosphotransferase